MGAMKRGTLRTSRPRRHRSPASGDHLTSPGLPNDLLQSILNSVADGIVVADRSGRFVLFNPAAQELVGVGASDTAPNEWPQYYGCYHVDGVTPLQTHELPLVRAISGEEVKRAEMLVRNAARPEGVWITCSARPLRDHTGQIVGGVLALHDFTQCRSAEMALRTTQEQDLEFQERLMSLIEVSHELSRAQTQDELFRLTLELGLSRLGFDRLGIRLVSDDGRIAIGCYGTDEAGRLRNEHHIRIAIDGLASEMLYRRQDYDIWENVTLGDDAGNIVGRGTRASASIWDGTRVVGVIHADNLLTGKPMTARDGRFLAHFASLLGQLSLRKRAEEENRKLNAELRERALDTEMRYRLVVRASRDAVWDWNFETGEIDWNEGIEQLFGYSSQEVSLNIQWWTSRLHPDDRERVSQGLRHVIESGGNVWSAEYRFARLDGSYAPVIDRGYVVRDEEGHPRRMVGAMLDMTQQKQAQEKLEESIRLLEATIESTADGILVVDQDDRIISYNRKFAEMWQIPEEVLRQRKDRLAIEFVLDKLKDPESFVAKVEELYHHPDAESEDVIEFKDGRVFERYSQSRRLGDQLVGRVWSFRDVTQRNRLQRQLLASQKLESIGTLAGGIAHDFNNLLAVILGNASMYLRDRSLPPKLRASLQDIVTAAERGSSLTHQMLAYARGGLQRFGPVDLNALVDSVVQMLRRTTPPQLEFIMKLDPALTAIHADPGQIEHVVMNLCLNAVQASEPPSAIIMETSATSVDAEQAASLEIQPGRFALFRVADSGCGMSPETMERIFEPFFTTKFTGRGMGLAAAQGIVNSHHGQIRVQSTLGAGTTMAVWLPLSPEATRHRGKLTSGRGAKLPTGTETVLILDDDVAVTRIVSQILQSLGYCVVAHTDADDMLAFLDNNAEDVHLVLQDLNVPRYSGEQIFRLIRERSPRVPILLASGFEEPQLAQRAREWGAAGHLQKPFSNTDLANMIRRVLDETAART